MQIATRVRSMLSLAFPHMVADEVELPEGTDETECLPDDRFLESMTGILSVLVYRKDSKESTNEITDEIESDSIETIKSTDGIITEDGFEIDMDNEETLVLTPIDDLELSIRSYNCLKRAGINTVEELQTLSDDDLMHVRNLGRKSMDEIKRKIAEIRV